MGRRKYDINFKSHPTMKGAWLVRFTNEEARARFNHEFPEFNNKVKSIHLDEWFPILENAKTWIEYNLTDYSFNNY